MARNKKLGKFVKGLACAAGITFAGMYLVAKKKKPDYTYKNEPEARNPLAGQKVVFVQDDNDAENADGVRGHLEAVGVSSNKDSFYSKYGKRAFDIVLSFGGLVVLAPVYAAIALAIKIEDPGPVLFTQKRMGQNKEYFKLHKFRSMKVSTPHDVPTHQLENPDQYITKVGKFIRAHSLDELPQIWDIFVGNMSVIGPRPGLWNQDLLTAERDKYGANDVKPGLTGWAQINGRDELEIPVKAKLDGEYVQKQSFLFDLKCFWGTVSKVSHDDSVVEGGTGEMKKKEVEIANMQKSSEISKRELGNTGIEITEMGFGCASVWGKKFISDYEAQVLFEKAYELGIRYFDTGYSYGLAEERIGKILKNSTVVDRDAIIISSKFGTKVVEGKYVHDWTPEWMRKSVETSMRRMQVDHLDLLMCHGPQISDLTDELLEALRQLKTDGLTRAIGINTFDTNVIEYVRDTKCFDFVMLDYNIMRQDRENLIEELHDAGIGVIAGAPLAESLYSNRVFKIRKLKDIWYLARAVANHRDKLKQKKNFKFLNNVPNVTSTQLALKYVLDNPNVTTAVFGTTTMEHLIENVQAVNVKLPKRIEEQIRRQKKQK